MRKHEPRRPVRSFQAHCAECQQALVCLRDDTQPFAAIRALKQLASHGLEPDSYARFVRLLADFVAS